MQIQAVIFDFDGTLVPFKLNYITLRQEIINEITEKGVSKDIFDMNDPVRVTLKKARELLNEKDMENLEQEAEKIISFYEMEGAKSNAITTEVSNVLKKLKEMDLKLGIFTLNQEEVVKILLNKANLYEMFDAIVTRNSVRDFYENIIKLNYLLTCLNELEVKGERTVVIGDHPIDMKAGKKVNSITIGVYTPRNRKALLREKAYDYLVDSIHEIPKIIGRLLGE